MNGSTPGKGQTHETGLASQPFVPLRKEYRNAHTGGAGDAPTRTPVPAQRFPKNREHAHVPQGMTPTCPRPPSTSQAFVPALATEKEARHGWPLGLQTTCPTPGASLASLLGDAGPGAAAQPWRPPRQEGTAWGLQRASEGITALPLGPLWWQGTSTHVQPGPSRRAQVHRHALGHRVTARQQRQG